MAELKTIDSSTIVKCAVTFIKSYTNQAYKLNINQNIIQLTKEGLGIRSTARILNISTTTLFEKDCFYCRKYFQANYQQRQNL